MGTPSMTTWPEASELPWFELFKPKLEQPSRLRETFFGPEKNVKTEAGMALAERLLSLRPHDRPSAREALKCAYFTLEDPPMELPTEVSVGPPCLSNIHCVLLLIGGLSLTPPDCPTSKVNGMN
jgi:CTD kinase subunit alpha